MPTPSPIPLRRKRTGAIIGGVVGGVVGLLAIAVACWALMIRKPRQSSKPTLDDDDSTVVETKDLSAVQPVLAQQPYSSSAGTATEATSSVSNAASRSEKSEMQVQNSDTPRAGPSSGLDLIQGLVQRNAPNDEVAAAIRSVSAHEDVATHPTGVRLSGEGGAPPSYEAK